MHWMTSGSEVLWIRSVLNYGYVVLSYTTYVFVL